MMLINIIFFLVFVGMIQRVSCQKYGLRDPPAVPTELIGLEATCGPTSIHVMLRFARPYDGTIYSKGAFYTPGCIYVVPGSGRTEYAFDIPIAQCGTTENGASDGKDGQHSYENTIVMQNDVHFQDILDVVRIIRCFSASQYEKIVDFAPINVNMKDIATATFTTDDVRVSIDIQNGRGPFAPSLNQGFIQIGDVITLVVYMTGNGPWDLQIRECVALDSQERGSLLLQDRTGCVSVPRLMSPFAQTRDPKNPKIAISYAFLKAFRFPDDMQVQIKCVVAVCRDACERPPPCAPYGDKKQIYPQPRPSVPYELNIPGRNLVPTPPSATKKFSTQLNSGIPPLTSFLKLRRKRQIVINTTEEGTMPIRRIFHVISPDDLATLRNSTLIMMHTGSSNRGCASETLLIVLVVLLFSFLLLTSAALAVTCLRARALRRIVKEGCSVEDSSVYGSGESGGKHGRDTAYVRSVHFWECGMTKNLGKK